MVGGCIGNGGVWIVVMGFVEMMGGVVCYFGQYQICFFMVQDYMFIYQYGYIQVMDFIDLFVGIGVVFVIVGDEVGIMLCLQLCQWCGVWGQLVYVVIDQVVGDGYYVGLQGVDFVDDGLQIGCFDGGVDVDVVDLDDGEVFQCCGQVGDGYVDFYYGSGVVGVEIVNDCGCCGEGQYQLGVQFYYFVLLDGWQVQLGQCGQCECV